MTIYRDVNNTPAVDVNYANVLYGVKELGKTAGFPVVASGDGVGAYNAAGDCITHAGVGANGLGNDLAWFVQEDPGGIRQWCWHHNPLAGSAFNWLHAMVGPGKTRFSGGNTAVRATSVDEVGMDGQAVVAAGSAIIKATDVYWHAVFNDEAVNGVYPWYCFCTDAVGDTEPLFGSLPLLSEDPGDADPSLSIKTPGDKSLNWVDLSNPASAYKGAYYDFGGGGESWEIPTALMPYRYNNSRVLPLATSVAPASGKYHSILVPIHSYAAGAQPYKGLAQLVWIPDTGLTINDVFTDQAGTSWVVCGYSAGNPGIMVPYWDPAVLCLPDLGGGLVTHDIIIDNLPATSDAIAPTISVVSPTPGGIIKPDEAFVVDVTDAGGLGMVVITVEVGSAHEVVWLHDEFSTAYATLSSVTPIANGNRYSIRRAGGWTSAPIFHVEAIDLGGNLGA